MNWKRIQNDESLPALMKGIGLTIVALATFIGIIQAKQTPATHNQKPTARVAGAQQSAVQPVQEQSVVDLAREVASLRAKLDEETTVEEVLVNPWFETLSLFGTGIFAGSFYLEWLGKRAKQTR
jgi:hypothetical protein